MVFMFEGQGSIIPFMGKSEYKKNILYKKYFDHYNSLLEFPIEDIIWGRKKEYRTNTLYAHMILYVTSMTLFKALKEQRIKPSLVIGHSLGELIATIASGAISEEDGAKLIEKRGQLFEKAKEQNNSDMLVFVGDMNILDIFISDLKEKHNIEIYKANYNSYNQLAISTHKNNLNKILIEGKKRKIKIVNLNVGIGCHSPFLDCVDNELSEFIENLNIRKPKIKLYSTSFNKELQQVEDIRTSLKKHLLSSVYWNESVKTLINKDYNTFVEVGHTKVLKGLMLNYKNITITLAPTYINKK